MLQNNTQRFNIWDKLNNKFNCKSFKEACLAAKAPEMDCLEFANKVGLMMCGKETYPDLDIISAYIKYVSENQLTQTVNGGNATSPPVPCGSCGGGQVR